MEYLICVILGFFSGVCATVGVVTYLGKREIKRRENRSKKWQKIKKEIDKAIAEEWEI